MRSCGSTWRSTAARRSLVEELFDGRAVRNARGRRPALACRLGPGVISCKMVGSWTRISPAAAVSTTNSRRWSVLPRPSLIEAANTSSRAGRLRWRSKKTAPRRRWSSNAVEAIGADRLEQRMARRDPFQGRVVGQQGLVEDDLAVLPAQPAEAGFLPVADGQQIARHLADAKHAGWPWPVSLGCKARLGGGLRRRTTRRPRAPAAVPWPRPTCRRWPTG